MIAALIAAVMIGFAAALGTDVAGIFYTASSSP
jgi:Flp pilus assembly pilin Flp